MFKIPHILVYVTLSHLSYREKNILKIPILIHNYRVLMVQETVRLTKHFIHEESPLTRIKFTLVAIKAIG